MVSTFVDKVTFAEPPGHPGPQQKGWEIRGFESPTTCGIPFASGESLPNATGAGSTHCALMGAQGRTERKGARGKGGAQQTKIPYASRRR
jgi:hypothetical protein